MLPNTHLHVPDCLISSWFSSFYFYVWVSKTHDAGKWSYPIHYPAYIAFWKKEKYENEVD